MNEYYQVSVIVEYEDNDKVKKVKELYLVQAVSVTDAEAKINLLFKDSTNLDPVVSAVSKTKIKEVIK